MSVRTCLYITLNSWTFLPTENAALASELSNAGLQCQSPTDICNACYEANPSAIWLAWLKCIYPDEHKCPPRLTAVVSLSGLLVTVREPNLQQQYSWRDNCRYAHSQEEVNYWKWKIAEERCKALVRYVCMVQGNAYVCCLFIESVTVNRG